MALVGLILASAKTLGSEIGLLYLFFIVLGSVAGATVFPYSVVVSRWFNRKRGLALGFMMLGMGIGAMAVPPIAQRVDRNFRLEIGICAEWLRDVVDYTSGAELLLRGDPRDKGLAPDGVAADDTPASGTASLRNAESGLSWQETWHRPEFWT